MKTFVAAVAFATLVTSSALAQPFNPLHLEHPTIGLNGQLHISAARAAALRACSAIEAQYPEYEWGNMGMYQYRACMTEHGQVE